MEISGNIFLGVLLSAAISTIVMSFVFLEVASPVFILVSSFAYPVAFEGFILAAQCFYKQRRGWRRHSAFFILAGTAALSSVVCYALAGFAGPESFNFSILFCWCAMAVLPFLALLRRSLITNPIDASTFNLKSEADEGGAFDHDLGVGSSDHASHEDEPLADEPSNERSSLLPGGSPAACLAGSVEDHSGATSGPLVRAVLAPTAVAALALFLPSSWGAPDEPSASTWGPRGLSFTLLGPHGVRLTCSYPLLFAMSSVYLFVAAQVAAPWVQWPQWSTGASGLLRRLKIGGEALAQGALVLGLGALFAVLLAAHGQEPGRRWTCSLGASACASGKHSGEPVFWAEVSALRM